MENKTSKVKKSQETLLKETFTKSFDERYAEMSKGEKTGHWIFVGFVFLFILLMLWFRKW
ncbi:hypothetical protein [Massilia sp.]|uniref:hypothetical protein n=1 Tax=Massilia sp. TaxID=1882437 RepID=UPI0028AA42BF|nr:hypothetical protein [Massilia sp.]